jgi:ribosomal protein S18 acetylase RimI-like enzyme
MNISSSDIEIRKVRYRDLQRLGNLFIHTFEDEVHPDHVKRRIHKIRQLYPLLRPLASVSPWVNNLFNFHVIKVKGKTAGFLQISYLNKTQLHLDYIAVDRAFQGQGIGSRVLRKLIAKASANGMSDIILEVRSDNNAYCLYKRLGFSTRARILHYGRSFGDYRVSLVSPKIPGLRPLRPADRAQLFQLKQSSIPERLQQLTLHENQRFPPSLFIRNLEWIKNRLMQNVKREYVVEKNGTIVASLEIYSYPKVHNHMMNLMVHRRHEELRFALTKYALFVLQSKYQQGRVTTTVYDDVIHKGKALEKAGFRLQAVYYLMARHSVSEKNQTLTSQTRYRPDVFYPARKHQHRSSQG